MTPIRVIKCDQNSQSVWEYSGELTEQGENWALVVAPFNVDDRDDGYFQWQRGDTFYEWYFYDRYYNVNKIFDRNTGALRGWYCNIARPAYWSDGVLYWDDLAMDVFIYPDGDLILKDEEKFAALPLDAIEHQEALNALNEIMALAHDGIYPFDR